MVHILASVAGAAGAWFIRTALYSVYRVHVHTKEAARCHRHKPLMRQLIPAVLEIKRTQNLHLRTHQSDITFTTTTTPQSFYGPFSRTTRVSRCQKRTCGLYGARED